MAGEREIVLLVPEYAHELRGSILQIAQRLLRKAADRDDLTFVMPYPAEGSRWKGWTPEKWEVPFGPHVEFVPVLMDKFSECPMGRVSTDWGRSKFGGRKDYYAVCSFRSTAPIGIRRLFSKPMLGFYPEIVNVFLAGDTNRFKPLFDDLPDEMLFQMLHSWNVVGATSGFFEKRICRQMMELFTASRVKDWRQRTDQVNLGIDIERLDLVQAMQHGGRNRKVRIAYGGRVDATKGINEMLEWSEQLFASGVDLELAFYFVLDRVGSEEAVEKYKRPFTRVEVNKAPVEENFFAYAKSADLFVDMSTGESTGLAWQEMLYLGVPGLFLDLPYVTGLIPPWYPLVAKTKADLKGKFQSAVRKLAAGEKLLDMDLVQDWLRTHHDRSAFENDLMDRLVGLSRAVKARKRPKTWRDVCAKSC